MLPRAFRLLPALVLCMSVAAPAVAQTAKNAATRDTPKPVTVNGKAIPKSRIEFVVKQRAVQGTADSEPLRKAVLDGLISQEVVAQEAERKGLAKNPEVQVQLDFARQQVLIQAYLQDYFKLHPLKDDQLLAEYNKVKASRGDKEYKARHILVDKEDEAKDIISQLKKGAKFEDLAKHSRDPGSKDRGGDLDWNPPSTFVKPFSDALIKLEKGKFTETPVQTPFGWHVIQLDDVRAMQFPAFAEVEPQIQNMLREQEIQKIIRDLRAKAKIE